MTKRKNKSFSKVVPRKKNRRKYKPSTLHTRSSTLINAFIHSVSSTVDTNTLALDVRIRDKFLLIDYNKCYYCKDKKSSAMDHLIASCNQKTKTFGNDSELNLFPSCSTCNSKKSNKAVESWFGILGQNYPTIWTETELKTFFTWYNLNKRKLYHSKSTVEYILDEIPNIKKICSALHDRAIRQETLFDL